MADKNVHSGHRKRLRDRARVNGLDVFDPHQILELLLFYAVPRQDTSETAHLLIDRFGTVLGALTAEESELLKVPGVGASAAQWLRAVGRLVTTYGELCPEDHFQIRNFRSVCQICEHLRASISEESTYCLCMTPSGVIQSCMQLCDSLYWGEKKVCKKCIAEVLRLNSRNVVILQFVSVARPEAEKYDVVHAENYAYTLRTIGAELLDVVLVGREDIVSMNQSGEFDRSIFGEPRSILSENYLREADAMPADWHRLPLTDEGL